MIIATKLTAEAAEGTLSDPRGTITAIHDETTPGFFRKAMLNGGGLILQRGDAKFALPLPVLWKLAEEHVPELRPPDPAAPPIQNPKSEIPN